MISKTLSQTQILAFISYILSSDESKTIVALTLCMVSNKLIQLFNSFFLDIVIVSKCFSPLFIVKGINILKASSFNETEKCSLILKTNTIWLCNVIFFHKLGDIKHLHCSYVLSIVASMFLFITSCLPYICFFIMHLLAFFSCLFYEVVLKESNYTFSWCVT